MAQAASELRRIHAEQAWELPVVGQWGRQLAKFAGTIKAPKRR
jgi:hypothetical protein